MRSVLTDSGLDRDRIETIPNWIDTNKVRPIKSNNAFRQQFGLDGKFVVMYSGNLGLCQGLDNVLLAAEQLKNHDKIVFVMVGDGASKQRLAVMAAERNLQNIRFVDYQPASQLSESLSAADFHLVPIDPRVSRFLMPSKLYGVLASATPAISVAPANCEPARLVDGERVGVNVEPDNPELLAEKILWFAEWCDNLQEYSKRARALAVIRFDRRVSVNRFRNMLQGVIGLEDQPVEISEPQMTTADAN